MNVIFRTDASIEIGSGHVIRCLTLANALQKMEACVRFICKEHQSNLISEIIDAGYAVDRISINHSDVINKSLAKAKCLDDSQKDDAVNTIEFIKSLNVDFMIVDHYAIDEVWHKNIRPYVKRILAIDDLGYRKYDCDVLLNQNYKSSIHYKYPNLVPKGTKLLLGTDYALIRNEFRAFRKASLKRRLVPRKQNILVFMGGSDPMNDTAKVLSGFLNSEILDSIKLNVVVGSGNPNQNELKILCRRHKNIDLYIQTSHMAELMANADLAITAGGTITWERCVLGLPSLVVVQSDDQLPSTYELDRIGAIKFLGSSNKLSGDDYVKGYHKLDSNDLLTMTAVSKNICDGNGAVRVAEKLIELFK